MERLSLLQPVPVSFLDEASSLDPMAGQSQGQLRAGADLVVLRDAEQHDRGAAAVAAFAEKRHPGDEAELLVPLDDPVVGDTGLVWFAHTSLRFRCPSLVDTGASTNAGFPSIL